MIQRQTSLAANLVSFCRFLRTHGFQSGARVQQDLLSVISKVGITESPLAFKLLVRSIICKTLHDVQQFDPLYEKYWHELDRALDSKIQDQPEGKKNAPTFEELKKRPPSFVEIKNWLFGNQTSDHTELAAYSPLSSIATSNLEAFTPSELDEIIEIIKMMAKALNHRKSRRFISSNRINNLIDVRETMRENLPRHEDLIKLRYKQTKERRVKLVLLCDTSKSMQLYSRLLIQFLFGCHQVFKRVQIFGFSTKLQLLSPTFRGTSFDQVIEKFSKAGASWEDGTRIGHSLWEFHERYAHHALSGKSVVLILSDGWDTGDPDLIRRSMRQIRKRSDQIIWLNPLADSKHWKAETMGMLAAMPFIDVLVPGHNLQAIRNLAQSLSRTY